MSGGGSETTQSNLPPGYVMDQHQQNLQVGNVLADQPYTPYSGPRIAGFTGDQQAGFDAIRRSVGQGPQTDMGVATAADVGPYRPASLATTDLSPYMNPWTQSVVDTSINDLTHSNNQALQSVESQAALGGAYGGSRMGVAQGETNRGYQDAVARTTAGLRQQGFFGAQQAAQQDINTGMQGQQLRLAAAQQMAQAELQRQQRDFGNAQALMEAGKQQQGMDQSNYDLAYQDFLRQQSYPMDQLQARQGLLSGPIGSTTTGTSNTDNSAQVAGSVMTAVATVAAAY